MKKEIIDRIKKDVKWYVQPRNMGNRTIDQLNKVYQEAVKLNLLNDGVSE